ncbi:MAG: hypothetical protein JNK12_01575 [Acidimicrobiales bacterium]|nr:hypothetical protein [Acidimicrobiales bacterium]
MFRSGGFPRARALAFSVALLAVAAATGCSSGEGDGGAEATVGRTGFVAAMEERYGVDGEQAACIADYVFEDYDPAEIAVLAEEGMPALPQARWEPYLNATVACITHDQPLAGGS